jgi:hypothetical protein
MEGSAEAKTRPPAPPSFAEALQQSISICKQLGSAADRNDEVVHTEDAPTYETGTFVKTIFDSGGDASENIPAFSRGEKFCVIYQHEGGWLEVPEGFLLVSWVTHTDPPPNSEAVRLRSREARKAKEALRVSTISNAPDFMRHKYAANPSEYILERGEQKLGLQIAGGSLEYPGIFVKKVRHAFSFR